MVVHAAGTLNMPNDGLILFVLLRSDCHSLYQSCEVSGDGSYGVKMKMGVSA